MNLPPRLPKKTKRASRWRSQAHLRFVRDHACANCAATAGIEAAHVRLGSGAGVGQKPDDFYAVSLCRDCHERQHQLGERTFWGDRDLNALVWAFVRASPKRLEIERVIREREQ